MFISELVQLNEKVSSVAVKDENKKDDNSKKLKIVNARSRYVDPGIIKSVFKSISLNFKKILSQLIKDNILSESTGRNDIKIYVNAAILETPEEFKAAKITANNKKKIKAFIVSKRDSIKIKESKDYPVFIKAVNDTIERITSSSSLDSLLEISNNIKELYDNFIKSISNDLNQTFRPLVQAEKRSLSVNVFKKSGEVFGIKLVAPNTSTVPEVTGGTYYAHEPNGAGSFPDYKFHFGTVENEDAERLRSELKINKDVNVISFEVKTDTNIVGKQRSPKTFLDNLKNKKIFSKLSGLKVGDKTTIEVDELIDILNADGLGVDKYTAYLNPAGKTSKTQFKKLKWLADFGPFTAKRNTLGQMAIIGNNGKTLFRIEIGSIAYTNGMFKESIEKEAVKILTEVNNVQVKPRD